MVPLMKGSVQEWCGNVTLTVEPGQLPCHALATHYGGLNEAGLISPQLAVLW